LKQSNASVKQENGDAVVKREYCASPVREGELEFISEGPAKKRFKPTEDDEVVDLD